MMIPVILLENYLCTIWLTGQRAASDYELHQTFSIIAIGRPETHL